MFDMFFGLLMVLVVVTCCFRGACLLLALLFNCLLCFAGVLVWG